LTFDLESCFSILDNTLCEKFRLASRHAQKENQYLGEGVPGQCSTHACKYLEI